MKVIIADTGPLIHLLSSGLLAKAGSREQKRNR
jgi:hypothetical protein